MHPKFGRRRHLRQKFIENYPNYIVNENGEIYNFKTYKKIKRTESKEGYYVVGLYNSNGPKIFYVHRLVAQAFLINRWNKPFVCHKNGNKLDNRVENLYWGTRKENARDAKRDGVFGRKFLSKEQVNEIRELCENGTTKIEIIKKFSINCATLYDIKKRKTHKHI